MAELQHGDRVFDVGCGPGTLTKLLVERVGPDAMSALDPSSSFVAGNGASDRPGRCGRRLRVGPGGSSRS